MSQLILVLTMHVCGAFALCKLIVRLLRVLTLSKHWSKYWVVIFEAIDWHGPDLPYFEPA